jgi:hypothetical protein
MILALKKTFLEVSIATQFITVHAICKGCDKQGHARITIKNKIVKSNFISEELIVESGA